MKRSMQFVLSFLDILSTPFVYPAALLLKCLRRVGLQRLPSCKRALLQIGVLPIRNHYYEPLFDAAQLRYPLNRPRSLPGIDWNLAEQLALLAQFSFCAELQGIGFQKTNDLTFHFHNGAFESGDAEYLYNIIRLKKPKRIIEIGSGSSTLIARRAVLKNQATAGVCCQHICIEPYEMPWLEKTGVTVIRQRVEDVSPNFFAQLERGDLLFIDSSHVIRPQGDVLFEYLELLPQLPPGVIVHIHDIFSPRDYLTEWVVKEAKLWNEQYLLEAFLTNNAQWKIIGALNALHHQHFAQLHAQCPYLTPEREPGSFYIEKIA